jgi:hypothetical protein
LPTCSGWSALTDERGHANVIEIAYWSSWFPPLRACCAIAQPFEGVGPSHRKEGNGELGKGFGAKAITYWTAGEDCGFY